MYYKKKQHKKYIYKIIYVFKDYINKIKLKLILSIKQLEKYNKNIPTDISHAYLINNN